MLLSLKLGIARHLLAFPSADLIPAEEAENNNLLTRNSDSNWHYKQGHIKSRFAARDDGANRQSQPQSPPSVEQTPTGVRHAKLFV